jgi:hypothetical protein
MAHGTQCVKDVRIQKRIDRFQHAAPPLNSMNGLTADRLLATIQPSRLSSGRNLKSNRSLKRMPAASNPT